MMDHDDDSSIDEGNRVLFFDDDVGLAGDACFIVLPLFTGTTR
jgi:hypothetical protein